MPVHITGRDANMLHKAGKILMKLNNKVIFVFVLTYFYPGGQDSAQIYQPPPARGKYEIRNK